MKPENYKIYKNPTVKTVIFQIRFSNLFIIENKIGDIQTEIMSKFPESSLTFRRELLFAHIGPQSKLEEIPIRENETNKIWVFKSDNYDYTLNVLTNALDITSHHHKSYYENGEYNEEGFRDIIEFTMSKFLSIIPLKKIKRIGLRYIDECPILKEKLENGRPFKLKNDEFSSWYNTSLPLNRFNLEDLGAMKFEADLKREDFNLIYRERLGLIDNEYKMSLDFDGYKKDIEAMKYLDILDNLHELIHEEWNKTIKEPVKNWMNGE